MEEKKEFKPHYCPNRLCCYHNPLEVLKLKSSFFQLRGWQRRKHQKVLIRAFRCKFCNRSFSERNFSINYRLHRTGHINARIFHAVVHNRSNRSIARELGVSECLVRTRVYRLFQIGITKHAKFLEKTFISEPIAYDGVECFARSQYEPNNINQAVGVNSLFCYLFNFAPMNRKGRMSERQKKYLGDLEESEGRFDPRAIRKTSAEMFQELIKRKSPRLKKLVLQTDEHFQYRKALSKDLSFSERAQIDHCSVSSNATRNYKNILFSVNHLDLLLRRYVAAFSRETICFAKKASRMIQKYFLFVCYKNYMRPQFVKRHKSDPRAHTHSPAMILGLSKRIMTFQNFFSKPIPWSHCSHMPGFWKSFYQDEVNYLRNRKHCRKVS